ncbi:PelA/Pel-15E family pectate lyase [Paenibacillus sp. V4I3]|uniref:pectate lyase n=1 Tax=unclassified Paenibacillus TaxID=185978 RepID=UPI00278742AC|nr:MULTISPECIES: pectate lyase [unclassified Paenibacillus]MDQ0875776.1 PelA/Pel-15E family pectate lyase [Paenibacillus sp. V4I3]MDQ0888152.1 PelA/Pel-15E family pectate lyase [Paenibacillus sp. V4I9]
MLMNKVKKRMLLPAVCSLGMLMLSISPAALGADSTGAEAPKIVKAEAVTPTMVKVTFNGKLSTFNPDDLELDAALGDWYSLNPKLTKTFTIKKVTEETNADGRTTVLLETEQAMNPDATITPPITENPKSVPFQKAAYYTGDAAKDIQQADNLLTWQTAEGGWYKYSISDKYGRAWDGQEIKSDWRTKDGKDIGTIDNNATTNEILFLALMYKQTGDPRYKAAVDKGFQFLLTMQYPSGGWPQVYPVRGNYSDYVTYNDNAMMRVMNVLTMAKNKNYPFNTDIETEDIAVKLQDSLDRGLDYILKSQIAVNGVLTAWCAQHDPVTYEPRGARAYEHPSISGSESVDIVKYLIALPNQTPEVKKAAESALAWFDANKLAGIKYVSGDKNNVYFVPDPASTSWYRFYEVGTNLPIFSGRDGIIKHNILEIEAERRNGYSWGGSWPLNLLKSANSTGYFEKRVYVKVVGSGSQSASGQSLTAGDVKRVEDSIAPVITLQPFGKKTGNHYNIDKSPWTLSGTLSEKAELRVNGVQEQVNGNLSFTSAPIPLHSGMNDITVTAVDAAGNQSVPLTLQAVPTEGTVKP